MEQLNILFAMSTSSDNKLEEQILSHYEKKFSKSFTYTKEYYLQGVIKALGETHYDIVFINEILEKEPIQPQYIDMLTDTFDELRIVLVINDNHREGSLCKTLYALGCYDCIFKSDLNLSMISEMIETPRKKKDAKAYYSLDESLDTLEEAVNSTGLSEIPEDELEKVLDNFNLATEEDIEELFSLAEQTYTFQQLVFLISTLSERVISLMESTGCNVAKYKKALEREAKKLAVNEKVKVIEKVVEKVVEKKVLVPAKPIKEIVEKEVIREVYKTPNDYKKVVAIVGGGTDVGATTIIDMISQTYGKEKKKVGIIDFTTNKDLFERHIFNIEDKSEPLQLLLKGIDKPYKINKNISLYTSSFNNVFDLDMIEYIRIIDTVKRENDIVFIDIDMKDILDVYSILDKVFIVVTQELTKTKEFTNALEPILKQNDTLRNDKKLQFIINRYINQKGIPSDKELIECYLYKVYDYLDSSSNTKLMENNSPILHFDFNIEILVNSYRGKYNTDLNEEDQLYKICNSVYPLSKKAKSMRTLNFGKLFKRPKLQATIIEEE